MLGKYPVDERHEKYHFKIVHVMEMSEVETNNNIPGYCYY